MANKETMIKVECLNPDGTKATNKLSFSDATSLLSMSAERGWGWHISPDSSYAYDQKERVIYRKKIKANTEHQ